MTQNSHHFIILSDDLKRIAYASSMVLCLPTDGSNLSYATLPKHAQPSSFGLNGTDQLIYVATRSQLTPTHQARIESVAGTSDAWVSTRQLIIDLSNEDCRAMMTAIQLLRWQADHKFCSRCGASSCALRSELAYVCTACHYAQYPRIQPCVIVAITRQYAGRTQLLMAHHLRYGDNPMYGLIAGFVEIGETLEQAVHREVLEETGLTVTNLRYHSSQPWAYPSNLMIGFYADYADGALQLDDTELSDAQFFDLDKLPKIPFKGSIARTLIDALIDG